MYVQSIADPHQDSAASIIESAGMYVKGARGPGRRGFRLKNGDRSGEVQAFTDKAGDRASYEWAYSTDGRVTWISLPVTNEARTTITGVWVRVHAAVKSVPDDWSDPASIIVT